MPRPVEKPSVWIDGRRPWWVAEPRENIIGQDGPRPFFRWTLEELSQWMLARGHSAYRAKQLFKWVYEKGVWDFQAMSDLGARFREELQQSFQLQLPEVSLHLKSQDGTEKFLFRLYDGNTIEAVAIPSEDRLTLCVSSEVGCNMACKFCFTGKQKLKRRLFTDEIVGQFLQVEKLIAPRRLTNIVFMGMGEPLDNPESVFKAIDILHSPFGRQFSRKKITVSTSGLVPEMWRIAASHTLLAVSLNGYDDESRTEIMPINKKYPLAELLAECRRYWEFAKEKITFEYVLLAGVTDQPEHAKSLYKLTRSLPCKINIIPFNEHPGSGFHRPSEESIQRFQNILIDLGAHVLRRRTMGRDIYAACGQLTSEFENKPRRLLEAHQSTSVHR